MEVAYGETVVLYRHGITNYCDYINLVRYCVVFKNKNYFKYFAMAITIILLSILALGIHKMIESNNPSKNQATQSKDKQSKEDKSSKDKKKKTKNGRQR